MNIKKITTEQKIICLCIMLSIVCFMYYGYITYGAKVVSGILIASTISILFGIFFKALDEQDA